MSQFYLEEPSNWKAPWPQSEPTPASPKAYCTTPVDNPLITSDGVNNDIMTSAMMYDTQRNNADAFYCALG